MWPLHSSPREVRGKGSGYELRMVPPHFASTFPHGSPSPPYHSDGQAEDFAELTAEQIIADGVGPFQLGGTDAERFAALPRGDARRDAIAWALRK